MMMRMVTEVTNLIVMNEKKEKITQKKRRSIKKVLKLINKSNNQLLLSSFITRTDIWRAVVVEAVDVVR